MQPITALKAGIVTKLLVKLLIELKARPEIEMKAKSVKRKKLSIYITLC